MDVEDVGATYFCRNAERLLLCCVGESWGGGVKGQVHPVKGRFTLKKIDTCVPYLA